MSNLSENEERVVQAWVDNEVDAGRIWASGDATDEEVGEIRIDEGWVRIFVNDTRKAEAKLEDLVAAAKNTPLPEQEYTPIIVPVQRRENPMFWLVAEVERARAADKQRIQDLEAIVSVVANAPRLTVCYDPIDGMPKCRSCGLLIFMMGTTVHADECIVTQAKKLMENKP